MAVSVNGPVEVPLTDTRSSWPVETDEVPALAEDDDEPDGNDEEPTVGVGLALAAEPGVPGVRKALGALVPPDVNTEGAEPFPPFPPFPPWPDGPPRADDGLLAAADAPCVDPPTAPEEGGP